MEGMLQLRTMALWLLLLLAPEGALAQCPVRSLPCDTDLGGWIRSKIGGGLEESMVGIVTAMLIFYALKLAISSQDENAVTEVRSAHFHLLFGAVLVTAASVLSKVIPNQSVNTIAASPVITTLAKVGNYFLAMVGTALTVYIGYQGIRLIAAQDESEASNAKQGLARSFVGITVVILATTMTDAFDRKNSNILGTELVGLGNFLASLLGTLSVVAIVVAGLFLIVSVDESYKDRAKKIIIGAAVTLIIVLASRSILRVFF